MELPIVLSTCAWVIVAGHKPATRGEEAGGRIVPVSVAAHLTVRPRPGPNRIADNQTSNLSTWERREACSVELMGSAGNSTST